MIEDAQALLHYMEALHVVVHIEYASIALLVFTITSSPSASREIRFVWDRTPWSLGRALFFITRYMPFIGTFLTLHVDMIRSASLPSCARWTQAAVYFNVADIVIAEMAVVTVARVQVGQNPFGEALYGAYGVCPPYFAGSNALSVAYMVLVAYETVLLILTLIKAIGHWREPGSSSFINVFFADGLSYNCFILGTSFQSASLDSGLTFWYSKLHREYNNSIPGTVGLYQPPGAVTTRTALHTHRQNDASS
uniref:DUF6533 domain-containing protein n=1 Tax=Moniliophthora roreri TaxID=221103 RepID=A0A0W0GE22_MONRR